VINDASWQLKKDMVGMGRKFINVHYGNKNAQYSIEVRNLFGTTDPDEDGTGIGLNWHED
jgi:hypothetical protein